MVAIAFYLLLFLSSCLATAIQHVSLAQWSALNVTLKGRLHTAVPFSRPCFSKGLDGALGHFDDEACSQIKQTYTDPDTRSHTFAAYMNTEWETCQATSQQCLLNDADPADPEAFTAPRRCAQGGVPTYYIDVREPADVQVAFDFSKTTRVPLVVKNSGHDYAGISRGTNTLALWMHNLQQIAYTPHFVASGCPNSHAVPGVTFGAGVNQGSLYDFAEVHNITLPGGAERSVSAAGGYLQGAGHSALSNAFGLAVDRVLEVKIVTADRQILSANACANSDLFFAVRGGGGGTFGVILEATEGGRHWSMFSFAKLELPTQKLARGLLLRPFEQPQSEQARSS